MLKLFFRLLSCILILFNYFFLRRNRRVGAGTSRPRVHNNPLLDEVDRIMSRIGNAPVFTLDFSGRQTRVLVDYERVFGNPINRPVTSTRPSRFTSPPSSYVGSSGIHPPFRTTYHRNIAASPADQTDQIERNRLGLSEFVRSAIGEDMLRFYGVSLVESPADPISRKLPVNFSAIKSINTSARKTECKPKVFIL